MTTTASAKTELFAKTATDTLVATALILDAKDSLTEAERMTSAWICDELIERMGGLPDMEEFDELLYGDNDLSFIEILLVAFPALVQA